MSIQSLVGEGHYFEETVTPERIRELLNKSSTETRSGAMEKTEGMKYLLAQMSKGRDVSEYYADVVRNVIVQSVDVKKLVYTYLVYHADANDTCRELALLAINTFQKDLSNRNELIRALALRVMCGIRVRDIIAIQVMTVKKAAFDTSPYVRKVAALCLPKVFSMDPATGEELTEVVERLLHDRATIVLSSSVFAWREVCPTRYDMLHSVYRKLAHTLADLDEWGQVMTLQVLTEYARTQFVDPRTGAAALREAVAARRAVKAAKPKKKKSGFYSDESSVTASDGEGEEGGGLVDDGDVALDTDHDLLLRACLPLLSSRSTAVVLAVADVYSTLAPRSRDTSIKVGEALTRAMRGHREVQYLLLSNCVTLAKDSPGMFRKYLKQFFVAASEPAFVKLMKVDILAALASPDTAGLILKEFTTYVKADDKAFVGATIRAVAAVGQKVPEVANRVLRGLMGLVATPHPTVVAQAVVAIRQLLQQQTTTGEGVILQLVGMLPSVTSPNARASMVWLVGEFLHKPSVAGVAPDALRILAKGFRSETGVVKEQVVTLAAKLWAFLFLPPLPSAADASAAVVAALGTEAAEADRRRRVVDALVKYVLELATYDVSYDLRDRTRLVKALLFTPSPALASPAAMEAALAKLSGAPPTAAVEEPQAAEAPPAPQEGESAEDGTVGEEGAGEGEGVGGEDTEVGDDDAPAASPDTPEEGAASGDDGVGGGEEGAAAAAETGAGGGEGAPSPTPKQSMVEDGAADMAAGSMGAAAAEWDSSTSAPDDALRSAAAITAAAGVVRGILLVHKPPPVLQGEFASSDAFRLGTMSHALGQAVTGYVALPDWAEEPSDPDTRDPKVWEEAQRAARAAARAAAAALDDSTDGEDGDTTDEDDDGSTSSSGDESDGSTSTSGSSGTDTGSSTSGSSSGNETGSSSDEE